MTKTITVTQVDIAKGQPSSSMRCPVALALKRISPEVQLASVGSQGGGGLTFRNGKHIRLQFPTEVVNFIKAFDTGQPVEPFSFEFGVTPGFDAKNLDALLSS